MKSFLVIGLGRFGRHLTTRLMELGNEVMVVDREEERVAPLASIATAACVGDCQDEQMLASLGVGNFDVCFVCVRDDFQCSLEVTAALKDLGAKCVVARADREKQIKFLKKIGADHVIHTEMDMAFRVAMRFSARNAFEYFELTPKYAVFEIETPTDWAGKTAAEIDVRRRYNVNILGIKQGDEIEPLLDPEYRFQPDTHLIVAGNKDAGLRLMDQV
ncbi:trk system potassium uptake protein TrkA [Oscillibacter sp. PC13]|uniref:potassium channel family protein n=1 Tax=Oscillibacter sp. PC13 TaxID=1855299 RepID=UPI0008E471EC|nr:TrkA family potassium uptake protein [Oscillibacter sp. PC13]SFP74789.1 trk system potassium uptake protein TrkA [Oscillibacter sp. PC13]